MKRIYSKIKPQRISKLFYTREAKTGTKFKFIANNVADYHIERDDKKNEIVFNLVINNEIAHTSIVYKNVHLSKKLGEPLLGIIGSCFTKEDCRGQGIYPYMLDYIAKTLLNKDDKIGILVSPENLPSIKGIEKAGFTKILHISTYRFLIFYFFTKKKF